jgi:hypothetical protein
MRNVKGMMDCWGDAASWPRQSTVCRGPDIWEPRGYLSWHSPSFQSAGRTELAIQA